jgi:hypothetical protein
MLREKRHRFSAPRAAGFDVEDGLVAHGNKSFQWQYRRISPDVQLKFLRETFVLGVVRQLFLGDIMGFSL